MLDSKHDGDFDDWPGRVGGDSAPRAPGKNQRYQVWQPLKIVPDEVEQWLWGIRQDAPAILEVDELVHLCYKKGIYSDEYNILLKTGRSLPVATISLTQELSRIPPNAFNQSNHRLGFLLEGRYNRLIWRDLLKAEKYTEPVDHYGVYYQHINGRGEPRYFENIQEFLGIQ